MKNNLFIPKKIYFLKKYAAMFAPSYGICVDSDFQIESN